MCSQEKVKSSQSSKRPMLMRSSKVKALTFLPLRQVWFLGGDKPVKSGFSQAPFYCFYTDLEVESGLNLLGALKTVRQLLQQRCGGRTLPMCKACILVKQHLSVGNLPDL
ncbi:hypothetical protein MRX96_025721 [Rhipicephalus microplus]